MSNTVEENKSNRAEFTKLVNAAFDLNTTESDRFKASIKLAKFCGVPEDEILKTTDEVLAFLEK